MFYNQILSEVNYNSQIFLCCEDHEMKLNNYDFCVTKNELTIQ